MAELRRFDRVCMARALRLAEGGRYSARPNPMVGCVIAKDGAIIADGFHRRAGEAHAEIHALEMAGKQAIGSTVYVTLEPCSHHGRTPPCTDALISSGVARVVIATGDPSEHVNGEGIRQLQEAGIDVDCGLLEQESLSLNEAFFYRLNTGKCFVRLKLAMSLDGATAMQSGESKWITSEAARADVQRLRAESAAIVTGIGTVLADDPSLTVRDQRFSDVEQPVRVVLDSQLRMPPEARMLGLPGETIVATSTAGKVNNTETLRLPAARRGVDLVSLVQELGARGLHSVLVEAGPTLAGQFLEAKLVNELVIYQAPLILGSNTRPSALTPAITALADGIGLRVIDRRQVGADTRVVARIQAPA